MYFIICVANEYTIHYTIYHQSYLVTSTTLVLSNQRFSSFSSILEENNPKEMYQDVRTLPTTRYGCPSPITHAHRGQRSQSNPEEERKLFIKKTKLSEELTERRFCMIRDRIVCAPKTSKWMFYLCWLGVATWGHSWKNSPLVIPLVISFHCLYPTVLRTHVNFDQCIYSVFLEYQQIW